MLLQIKLLKMLSDSLICKE